MELKKIEDSINPASVRYSSADWANLMRSVDISILGCGGIGSWTALLISRLDPSRIVLTDFDIVQEENLAGQFFEQEDLNRYKTAVVSNKCKSFSNFWHFYTTTISVNESNASTLCKKITIACFDNMKARQAVFNAWKILHGKDERYLYIDGRLSAEELQVMCIQGGDSNSIEDYETSKMFNDSEAASTVCSYKQTSFMANMIASIIANLVVNFISNENGSMRIVPYYTEYNGVTMTLKTED